MPAEEVIELSVEETNKLRAKLGMAPLRLGNSSNNNNKKTHYDDKEEEEEDNELGTRANNNGNNNKQDEAVLELSVDETNALRAKLGLAPLRVTGSGKQVQNANLKEKQQELELAKAQERAKLEEDVVRGIASTFTAPPLGAATTETTNDVTSWAAKLRQSSNTNKDDKDKKSKKKKKKKSVTDSKSSIAARYDEEDLKGLNVSHAMSELEAGTTTVMTLADVPLLQTAETNPNLVTGLNDEHVEDTNVLENVNLAEATQRAEGLRKKRQLEMGLGRAGGYAGFDDDEFVELGGTRAPGRLARGGVATGTDQDNDAVNNKKKKQQQLLNKGFRIGLGSDKDDNQSNNNTNDLFAAMEAGKAISLEPTRPDVQASDFMTEQEDLELRGKKEKKSKRKEKFEKKEKKKKKDKKEKKHHRRHRDKDDDDDEDDDDDAENQKELTASKSLLEELEETAEDAAGDKSRKRSRRNDKDDDDDHVMQDASPHSNNHQVDATAATAIKKESDQHDNVDGANSKRAKYDAIMDKGNARTQLAFAKKKRSTQEDSVLDEEPDDAFLNAALAKARRLKKLKDMSLSAGGAGATMIKGAEAVVQAVQQMPDEAPSSAAAGGEKGIMFSIDDTREFSRALRAKTEQQNRKAAAKQKETPAANMLTTVTTAKIKQQEQPVVESVKAEEADEDVDMEELVKEIKDDHDDDNNFLEGTTGNTIAVGRGLAGVVNLFKQTGDLTRKNAGMEELRGRAKDERNYEDYEPLDLKKVVNIDERYATDKDRELAKREVKLEYRDKHGRLLTRKEAFRELCYQFHGHGSSKRKEEKRMKQMAREQAEARLASQQSNGGPGTFGALKATQKATGKAYVVHKT